MFFPVKFSRWKGAAQPATIPILLGGDTNPPTAAPTVAMDNVLVHKVANAMGWPTQRVAVGYKAPSGTLALHASLYFWEANSEAWYRIGAADRDLTPGVVLYFDTLSLIEEPPTALKLARPTAGCSQLYLAVTDPGAAPDGAHVFVMGADITNTET